jgi:GNAT superfamily N-acetyltransferase
VSFNRLNRLPIGYSLKLFVTSRVWDSLSENRTYNLVLFFVLFLIVSLIVAVSNISVIAQIFVVLWLPVCLYIIIRSSHISEVEVNRALEDKIVIGMSIQFKERTCAYIAFKELESYTFINGLFVDSSHRNRGLGSYLVSYCVQSTIKDSYLVCYQNLKPFYRRHGFVDTNYINVPSELLKWRRRRNLSIMVFRQVS